MIKNKHDEFSILPELDITLIELQQHVAEAPAPGNSHLRYVGIAAILLCVGAEMFFAFGNKSAEVVEKKLTPRSSTPLITHVEKKENDQIRQPLYVRQTRHLKKNRHSKTNIAKNQEGSPSQFSSFSGADISRYTDNILPGLNAGKEYENIAFTRR